MRYSREKIKELTGIEIKGDYGYLEVLEEQQYKSKKQNALFHSLLSCFWESKLSSFDSYEDLRNHYKRVAHLCDVKFDNRLKDTTKNILWRAIKLLPLPKSELDEIVELIKGRTITWRSWADCSKEMAKVTLDQLINDMINAGVNSKKFNEIMRELNEKETYSYT